MPISANSTSTWQRLAQQIATPFAGQRMVTMVTLMWRGRKSWRLMDPCHSFSYARNEPWHDMSMACIWHTDAHLALNFLNGCSVVANQTRYPAHCISRVFAQRSQRHCLVTCEFPWFSSSPKEDPGSNFKVTEYRASSPLLCHPSREATHSWLVCMAI